MASRVVKKINQFLLHQQIFFIKKTISQVDNSKKEAVLRPFFLFNYHF